MDIKKFVEEFKSDVNNRTVNGGLDEEKALLEVFFDYMRDSGDVNEPEVLPIGEIRDFVTAYEYNEEAKSLTLIKLTPAHKVLDNNIVSGISTEYERLVKFALTAMYGESSKNGSNEGDATLEMSDFLKGLKDRLNRLRLYVVTDGLIDKTFIPSSETIKDVCTVEFYVWDMRRAFLQFQVRAGNTQVLLDLSGEYDIKLPCLKLNGTNSAIDVYMTTISGPDFAKIYKKYRTELLAGTPPYMLNLNSKHKIKIAQLLSDEPEMLISYSNGISTTAYAIDVVEQKGVLYITGLYDWQIVDGVPLADVIATSFNEDNEKLSRISIPVKICVVNEHVKYRETLRKISTNSNDLSVIDSTDFGSGDTYYMELEKLSRSTWAKDEGKKYKWYFERICGQYLSQCMESGETEAKIFRDEYPNDRKFNKADIAEVEYSWNGQPFNVAMGLKKKHELPIHDCPEVTADYYKQTVAKLILFRIIESTVASKALGGYMKQLSAYLMASISYLSDKKLDLEYIWNHQQVQQGVLDRLEFLIPLVWIHLVMKSDGDKQFSDINEWCKMTECWNSLEKKLDSCDKFENRFLRKEPKKGNSRVVEKQEETEIDIQSIEAETWFNLANWAKARNQLSPVDRKAAFNFGSYRMRGENFRSEKQVQYAMRIYKKSKELGFQK